MVSCASVHCQTLLTAIIHTLLNQVHLHEVRYSTEHRGLVSMATVYQSDQDPVISSNLTSDWG